jgi:aminopeptidase
VTEYALLLVDRCIDPKPGDEILVLSTPLGRPVVEEVVRRLAQRGCYALLRIDFAAEQFPVCHAWSTAAPEELLAELAPIDRFAVDNMNGRITINAPENTRDGSELPPERYKLLRKAVKPYYNRTMGMEVPWVGCHFPTKALAQEAGMTLAQYEDFLYGACLIDWDEQHREIRRLADRWDEASEVRIVGEGTDLRISLEGRKAKVDTGRVNMPGGEFFFGPVEDSAEGVIAYSEFPAEHNGHEVTGIRLRFEAGKVVDASAASGEEFLLAALDTDVGSRYIGELGIGCNRKIDRHTKRVLFDEKIHGTIHVALGASYPDTGGKNVSNLHWDMVKDLRQGGRIELDGKVVQENGEWKL